MLTTLPDRMLPGITAGGSLKPLRLALVGQPNVGKSTIFNKITGSDQYVGNWPGKTSVQKTALCRVNGTAVEVIDLPGTYGLTAGLEEERLVRETLLNDPPDVVAVIVNAATIEHNLYLLAEVLALPLRVVVGLNMVDLAALQGMQVRVEALEAGLRLPVVGMTASRTEGVQELMAAAIRLASDDREFQPYRPEIRQDHALILEQIELLIDSYVPTPYPGKWIASKLLEGDEEITRRVQDWMGERWGAVRAILVQHDDAMLAIASGRYDWIARILRGSVVRPHPGMLTLTDRIDRIVTHPFWGLLVLLGVLGALFWLTYSLGSPLQIWLENRLVAEGSLWASQQLQNAPGWVSGLIVHGVFAGVGSVLTLLPILLIFFAALSLLEDLGYMARAAFVMDRFMHRMGLHGQSFLPLFLGFGCNVPAVMATRVIESPKSRLTTILITPLVPCTARMAVITLLAPIFFGEQAIWVAWGLVALSLATLVLVGTVLHEGFLGGEHNAFIMELPLYHRPDWRTIGRSIRVRLVDFLKMAGSIILVVSVVLWALSTYPGGSIESSYMAAIGRWLAPLGALMGLGWPMLVALLASFIRKENTIPTLAVLYGAGGAAGGLETVLSGQLTPAAALAFLAVQILFIPCLATLASIRQQTGSWKWTLTSVVLLLVVSLSVGIAIYQGARWTGWGI